MLYLLDTNILSDLIREQPEAQVNLGALSPSDAVITCVIAKGEVLFGVRRMPDGRMKRDVSNRATRLFDRMTCVPVPVSAADHFAEIRSARERKGLSMDDNDLWIASTARALGAVLVTRDSDMRGVEGLTIEDWSISP